MPKTFVFIRKKHPVLISSSVLKAKIQCCNKKKEALEENLKWSYQWVLWIFLFYSHTVHSMGLQVSGVWAQFSNLPPSVDHFNTWNPHAFPSVCNGKRGPVRLDLCGKASPFEVSFYLILSWILTLLFSIILNSCNWRQSTFLCCDVYVSVTEGMLSLGNDWTFKTSSPEPGFTSGTSRFPMLCFS